MSTMESASKIGCTTSLWQLGLRLNGSEARSIFDRIAAGTSSPTFRSVVSSWDGTNAVRKITDDPPNLLAPVNPSTLPAPVPIITVLGPWQGTDSFLKKNQDVACLCD
jgi:hypothetical protein